MGSKSETRRRPISHRRGGVIFLSFFPFVVNKMEISNEEALSYLYLQKLGACNMYDVTCVQLHATRLKLTGLARAIGLDAGERYYYILENYAKVVPPIQHLLDEFIFKRRLLPV